MLICTSVSNLWKKGYRGFARTMGIAVMSLAVCATMIGCEVFKPDQSRPMVYTDTQGSVITIPGPSQAETAIQKAQNQISTVQPIVDAANPVTGGTAGLIFLSITNVLSLVGNILQRYRENGFRRVITTVQRDTDTGIIPMMKTADPTTMNFARKIVGEG